jgi:hypothetical protein
MTDPIHPEDIDDLILAYGKLKDNYFMGSFYTEGCRKVKYGCVFQSDGNVMEDGLKASLDCSSYLPIKDTGWTGSFLRKLDAEIKITICGIGDGKYKLQVTIRIHALGGIFKWYWMHGSFKRVKSCQPKAIRLSSSITNIPHDIISLVRKHETPIRILVYPVPNGDYEWYIQDK